MYMTSTATIWSCTKTVTEQSLLVLAMSFAYLNVRLQHATPNLYLLHMNQILHYH